MDYHHNIVEAEVLIDLRRQLHDLIKAVPRRGTYHLRHCGVLILQFAARKDKTYDEKIGPLRDMIKQLELEVR